MKTVDILIFTPDPKVDASYGTHMAFMHCEISLILVKILHKNVTCKKCIVHISSTPAYPPPSSSEIGTCSKLRLPCYLLTPPPPLSSVPSSNQSAEQKKLKKTSFLI